MKKTMNNNEMKQVEYVAYMIFASLFGECICINPEQEKLRQLCYAELPYKRQCALEAQAIRLLEKKLLWDIFRTDELGKKAEMAFVDLGGGKPAKMIFNTYGWSYILQVEKTWEGLSFDLEVVDLLDSDTPIWKMHMVDTRRPITSWAA